jgi:beta-lactamase class A
MPSSSLWKRWSVAGVGCLTALATVTLPGAARAASMGTVSVICPQVGELTVQVVDDAPPAAVALPPGAALHVAYDVRSRHTGAAVHGGDPGAVICGQVPLRGAHAAALPGFRAPTPSAATDTFDGTLTVGLTLTATAAATPAPDLAATAAVSGAGTGFPFAATISSYLKTRSGVASVAVFDAKTGITYSYAPGSSFVTASIVKASILGTLLRQTQDAGRGLTGTEKSLATSMIEQSDNNAATSLWNEVGKGTGVGAFLRLVGMPSTTPGSDGYWGLTTTNTPDQVKLVRTVAYPNTVLSDASRGYEESLMRAVTPSQRWGVTGGVPSSATVALKNGWLPRSNGWAINSIGHVRGGDRDYAIAVLSSGSPSMNYGIATVEHLSSLVWSQLPRPYRHADVDGALVGGGSSGHVELHTLSNSSGYTAWALHRATAFAAVDPADWLFAVAPSGGDRAADLYGVQLRNTGSGGIEVHVVSAASGYAGYLRHTVTALPAIDPAQWQFTLGSVGGDGGTDLVGVRTAGTASGRVEVHILSEASGYRGYLAHATTPVTAGDAVGAQWRWMVGDGGDLIGVAHAATGSGATEVHVLSWSSGYQSWRLHAATPLGYTDDAQWRFTVGDFDANGTLDLFALRTVGGASGGMEVHVLSGATAFRSWLRHAATPLRTPVAAGWQWSAF